MMFPGLEVLISVEVKYAPKDSDTEKEAKQYFIVDAKEMNALLSGLCESEFIKLIQSKNSKDIWDTL